MACKCISGLPWNYPKEKGGLDPMYHCSAILSATQTDALAQLQAKLDTVLISAGAQSNIVQTDLRGVLETVQTLPQIAAAIEEISDRVDKLLVSMS